MKTTTDVQNFPDHLVLWTSSQPDVHGVALVGSYARGEARADSDVDLVILTDQPDIELHSVHWAEQFGKMAKHQTEDYGKLTSLRVWYQDGLEVEYGITTHERPSLAAYALSDVWETWTQQEELPHSREMGCSLIIYFRFAYPLCKSGRFFVHNILMMCSHETTKHFSIPQYLMNTKYSHFCNPFR